MRIRHLFAGLTLFIALGGIPAESSAQKINTVQRPDVSMVSAIMQMLASPGLEGRETGTRGGYLAANYVASMMEYAGLKPYGSKQAGGHSTLSDYFHPFKLLRYAPHVSPIEITGRKNSKDKLFPGKDFTVEDAISDLSLSSQVVFAGYGISDSGLKYNDYAHLDVKNKIVLVIEGYPGKHDTLSPAWLKFRKTAIDDAFDTGKKCREAERLGAKALVLIPESCLKKDELRQPENLTDGPYQDAEYFLPSAKIQSSIPLIQLTESGAQKIEKSSGLHFADLDHQIACEKVGFPLQIEQSIKARIDVTVDTLLVYNVIGCLRGSDTTKSIILGAHYDHLGIRDSCIYYGSDDNASGVAGLLAIAGMLSKSMTVPSCNLVFASWTAEEKGLIGSEYFTSQLAGNEGVKLYINMDMISRSVSEDTACNMLSVGTRTCDSSLREMAADLNSSLGKPFILDLWDVTGHSGSDYASFTAKNIPILTFNTGLHNDYHTPRDTTSRADFDKMLSVIQLVCSILNETRK